MTKLKTVIIDDERDCINLLKFELGKHCPNIEVIASFSSSTKALNEIELLNPDLVFLDIEMPVMNGFELLKKLMPVNFNIFFVTAYNQFALKAFRFNALDYLLKPFDINDLIESVEKVSKKTHPSVSQLEALQRELKGGVISKIAIPGQNGVTFIEINDIVFAEASNNYTKLILLNKQQHVISKTLKDVQDVLEERHFLRVHRQYIINLNHVKQFFRGDNMYVVMNNGENIPVARSQKDKLVEKYGWL
ncbi:MAG: response regulator [Bacteroidota bacterium]|nr:response regulator [Bacteroidota bacterium]